MTESTELDMFRVAANRLTIMADAATPGPWRRASITGVLACHDAEDGSEQHLCYGVARKEDIRLMVAAGPETFRLLAKVFAHAGHEDASLPELLELAAYLNKAVGLKLPIPVTPATS